MGLNKGLALFDFDGTISNRDSFLYFMWWFKRGLLLQTVFKQFPKIILFKFGYYPNQRLKEAFLRGMFAGVSAESLGRKAEEFCTYVLPSLIRPGFWHKYDWHRQRGHIMVVVTATPRLLLEKWCQDHHMDIIGSELQSDQRNRITGRLSGLNCMGEEKVRRINEHYAAAEYREIFAYGDTSGDLPMLNLAPPENRSFKPFR